MIGVHIFIICYILVLLRSDLLLVFDLLEAEGQEDVLVGCQLDDPPAMACLDDPQSLQCLCAPNVDTGSICRLPTGHPHPVL